MMIMSQKKGKQTSKLNTRMPATNSKYGILQMKPYLHGQSSGSKGARSGQRHTLMNNHTVSSISPKALKAPSTMNRTAYATQYQKQPADMSRRNSSYMRNYYGSKDPPEKRADTQSSNKQSARPASKSKIANNLPSASSYTRQTNQRSSNQLAIQIGKGLQTMPSR